MLLHKVNEYLFRTGMQFHKFQKNFYLQLRILNLFFALSYFESGH